jgi:rhodanese-related sulfurtransferase
MAIAEITVDELAELIEAGPTRVRLVDVREVDEYVSGHVPGAELVVLSTVPDHVDVFRGEGPVYVICKTGPRSRRACEFLEAQGLDVVNVAGGTLGWKLSGREVVEGDQPL